MIVIFDIAILFSTALSSWFWWKASGKKLRRIARDEVLDARDINRIIVTINRGQILNARAALSTAVSAGLVAVRFFLTLLEGQF